MVFPRFSLRWLLIATTVLGVVSLVTAHALDKKAWAVGIASALLAAVVMLFLFAGVFLVSQWFALLGRLLRGTAAGASPFADAGRPLQIIPPSDPE